MNPDEIGEEEIDTGKKDFVYLTRWWRLWPRGIHRRGLLAAPASAPFVDKMLT